MSADEFVCCGTYRANDPRCGYQCPDYRKCRRQTEEKKMAKIFETIMFESRQAPPGADK